MNDPSVQKIIDEYRSLSKKMMDRVAATQIKVVPPRLLATYESGSVPGLMYNVKRTGDNLICNCPGYVYRRKCKHTGMAESLIKKTIADKLEF